jgi:hypothetical protein
LPGRARKFDDDCVWSGNPAPRNGPMAGNHVQH